MAVLNNIINLLENNSAISLPITDYYNKVFQNKKFSNKSLEFVLDQTLSFCVHIDKSMKTAYSRLKFWYKILNTDT